VHALPSAAGRPYGTAGSVPRVVTVRSATEDDAPFLAEMLLCAVNWDDTRPALTMEDVRSRHELAHYVEGWMRPGDAGVVALDTGGQPVGAAWLRRFSADDRAYGFIAEDTPELSLGVRAEHRGQGVGTTLCREILTRADRAGVPQVSLSVERANRAKALYERLGFRVVGSDDAAVTMVHTREPGPA
jgi:ribosomal protein S18 acetylase RimI-like enzyme